jgi:hypothetical protein
VDQEPGSLEYVRAFMKEQEIEFGTYVAVQDIPYHGVVAYREGDPVPVSNVKKYKYDEDGYVRLVHPPEPDDGHDQESEAE